jgi:hypothetical protein
MRSWLISALRITLAALLTVAGFGQAVSPSPPSYRFSSGSAALNIPVEIVANGLVFVRAAVNGHSGWFILDNATQGFAVDSDYARQISLETSDSATARGGGSDEIQVKIADDARISLPGLDLTHRHLVVLALKPIEPSVGHEVDGIIGSRLFDDFVVEVGYVHRFVSIYLPQEYRPFGEATAIPVRVDPHGFPFIDATIALPGIDPITSSFLIDGGANTYADVYKPFSDAHHLPPGSMKLLDEPGTSTGGPTQSRDGRADRISVGPFSIKDPPITFAQDTEGLMAVKDQAGLIGAEFLERFTVVFDNPGKRLWLTPNSSYSEPPEYDESGLRMRADGAGFHKFAVTRIVPLSPAAEAGIEAGDVIESIGNSSAQELNLTELRRMLCRPGARYSIGVVRSNRRLRVELRLRPLL